MTQYSDIVTGSVVISLKGRDAGLYFVVVGLPDSEGYLLLADGKTRKLQKPKRKKLKHVRMTDVYLPEIADKLVGGKHITDRELKKAIDKAVAASEN